MTLSAMYSPSDHEPLTLTFEPPMQKTSCYTSNGLYFALACMVVTAAITAATYTPPASIAAFKYVGKTLTALVHETENLATQLAVLENDIQLRTRRVIVYDACVVGRVIVEFNTREQILHYNNQWLTLQSSPQYISAVNNYTAWLSMNVNETYVLKEYEIMTSNPLVTYCTHQTTCHPCGSPSSLDANKNTGFVLFIATSKTHVFIYLRGNGYTGSASGLATAHQITINTNGCTYFTLYVPLTSGLMTIATNLVEVVLVEQPLSVC